jgi:hypothetical protein
MLECLLDLDDHNRRGLFATDGEAPLEVCILGDARHKVTVLRDFSEEEFRQHPRHSNDTGRRYIVNFSRERIFGAGVGHFSLVGGYLEAEDLVFILDVNSEYQPWLVASKRLFDAVNTFDGNRKRGFLLIE